MNALHAQIADLDPDWVKREHRREIRFWVSLGVAILAIAAATWAVVKNGEQDRQITQVQHSACEVDAGGRECQKTRRESSRAANIATTCIPFWKAGYRCPKPGSPAAERELQTNSKEVQNLEQGGDQPQATAPAGDTEGVKPPKEGSDGKAAPHNPASPAPPAPLSPGSSNEQISSNPAPTAATPTAPATSPAPLPAPSPEAPEPETPAPLAPILTKVCSVVDRLAHLC